MPCVQWQRVWAPWRSVRSRYVSPVGTFSDFAVTLRFINQSAKIGIEPKRNAKFKTTGKSQYRTSLQGPAAHNYTTRYPYPDGPARATARLVPRTRRRLITKTNGQLLHSALTTASRSGHATPNTWTRQGRWQAGRRGGLTPAPVSRLLLSSAPLLLFQHLSLSLTSLSSLSLSLSA